MGKDKQEQRGTFRTNQPSVCLVTLGCAKNEVDSTHMSARLRTAGFRLVEAPEDADAVIVNTCSFIEAATEESLEVIFDLMGLKGVKSGKTKVIVAGCMPSRYGHELDRVLPEASAFIPCNREDDVVALLCAVLDITMEDLAADVDIARMTRSDTGSRQGPLSQNGDPSNGDASLGGSDDRDGVASAIDKPASNDDASLADPDEGAWADTGQGGLVSAYLKISEGCDRFCSYCTIPFIRGRYRSFPLEAILAEADGLVAQGARELVLIAQDTGRWGSDLDEPSSLAQLLEALALRFPRTWLRIMYLQPEGIDDALLDVMARYPTICDYLDIPLQHVDADILKAMNRKGSAAAYRELVARIKRRLPQATLRTTLIAGFPGESEEAFQRLCDFVDEECFHYVGVFPFSAEEGTLAAKLPGQISEEEKLYRTQTLRELADAVGHCLVAEKRGTEVSVLVIGYEEDGQVYGRTQAQAPEVDGVVFLQEGRPGEIVTVTITDSLLYEMEGE